MLKPYWNWQLAERMNHDSYLFIYFIKLISRPGTIASALATLGFYTAHCSSTQSTVITVVGHYMLSRFKLSGYLNLVGFNLVQED